MDGGVGPAKREQADSCGRRRREFSAENRLVTTHPGIDDAVGREKSAHALLKRCALDEKPIDFEALESADSNMLRHNRGEFGPSEHLYFRAVRQRIDGRQQTNEIA